MATDATWPVSVTRVHQDDMMDILFGWLDIFGPGCIWRSDQGLTSWAGEPVMYCVLDIELALAYAFVNETHLPFVVLIRVHP
jgi:hypothetical protein